MEYEKRSAEVKSAYEKFVAAVNAGLAAKGEHPAGGDEQITLLECYKRGINTQNTIGSITMRRTVMGLCGRGVQG